MFTSCCYYTFLFSSGQKTNNFTVVRAWEHVYRAVSLYMVACCLEWAEVPCKAGWLEGDIDDSVDAIGNDLFEGFRMNAVSRRIKNDDIWAGRIFVAAILPN